MSEFEVRLFADSVPVGSKNVLEGVANYWFYIHNLAKSWILDKYVAMIGRTLDTISGGNGR